MKTSFFYSEFTKSQQKAWWIFLVVVYAFLIIRATSVSMFDEGKVRDSIHGDAYSDKNTYSALRFFYDHGFKPTCYLPYHYYSETKPINPRAYTMDKVGRILTLKGAYTHYPALPDILAGIFAKIAGTTSEGTIRLFPILISILFVWVIFQSLWLLLQDAKMTFWAGLIIVGSNYFIFWADNLHKHMYEEFFKWLFLFCLLRYFHSFQKRWMVAAYLTYVANTNVSYETVPYMAILTVGLSWVYTRKIISWETVIMATAPFIGFGLHIWQVAVYKGSLEIVYKDFMSVLTMRSVGDSSSQNELKRSLTIWDVLQLPLMWSYRIERYFLISGPALVVLGVFAWRKAKALNNVKLKQIFVVILLATFSWNVVMSQHSLVHIFTTRHAGILVAVLGGYGLFAYLERLKTDWSKEWYWKALHVGFCGYMILIAVSQQLWDVWRYGFGKLF